MTRMDIPQKRVIINCLNARDNFMAFKDNLKIGDVFMLTLDDMGIEQDATLPYYQKCKIVKLFPYHAYLEHKHKTINGDIYTHKCCVNYGKLFILSRKKNNNRWN